MITKEEFFNLISSVLNQENYLDDFSSLGLNISEHKIVEFGWKMFDEVLNLTFTEMGVDYINKWLWEEGYDDEKIISCTTIFDLWNIVKDYRK